MVSEAAPLPTLIRSNRRAVNADPHPDLAVPVTVTRFWRSVATGPALECWEWLGDTDDDGYGVFFWAGRKRPAHELALSFTTGEARLTTLDTCHSCDNPSCCNPDHLRFDTRLSNVREMHERGRDRNGNKLSPAQVIEMRNRRANGARQIDLARQYGVGNGTVSMIVRGLRWADVGGPIESKKSQPTNVTQKESA